MMIGMVVNFVVNLGLPMQCIDLNILWWWVLLDWCNFTLTVKTLLEDSVAQE